MPGTSDKWASSWLVLPEQINTQCLYPSHGVLETLTPTAQGEDLCMGRQEKGQTQAWRAVEAGEEREIKVISMLVCKESSKLEVKADF